MILQRLRRLVGAAILVLAPSIGLAQSALQQPNLVASPGVAVDTLPAAITKLYQNDLFLQNLVAGRFNTLGAAAYLNVGTTTGTVADGGALSVEVLRAKAAETANATNIATNAAAIATETSRAQGVEALKAPIASPTFTGTPRVPTAAQGSTGTQAASLDFVATAVAAGAGGNQGVPPSRQVLGGGLASGGGDLTADRTITVLKAAQSDVAAGTDDAKALTSYSVAARLGALAPLASPQFVGTPVAPTAAAGTNTTQLATAGFVTAAAPRVDLVQSLTLAQQLQGRQNLGAIGSGILAKTAAYTVTTADAGRLISASGTFAITLPAAATAGNGFSIQVGNGGTGKITLTPNGSETIRGASSLVVNAQESGQLISDGTNWQAIGFTPVIVASSAANGSGYTRWSNSYCVQWGTVANSDATVSFPLAYAFTPAVVATFTGVDSSNTVYAVNWSSLSTTGFVGRARYGNTGGFGSTAGSWNWRAEGACS